MSELSPGSKATTNLFMVLGIVSLGALALSVTLREEPAAANCDDRLQQAGEIVWDPAGPVIDQGTTQIVTLQYTLSATGEISAIRVTSKASPYDAVAERALRNSRFAPAEDAEPLVCSYSYTLRLE